MECAQEVVFFFGWFPPPLPLFFSYIQSFLNPPYQFVLLFLTLILPATRVWAFFRYIFFSNPPTTHSPFSQVSFLLLPTELIWAFCFINPPFSLFLNYSATLLTINFVVINPCVLSANRDLSFLFHNFPILPPPPRWPKFPPPKPQFQRCPTPSRPSLPSLSSLRHPRPAQRFHKLTRSRTHIKRRAAAPVRPSEL